MNRPIKIGDLCYRTNSRGEKRYVIVREITRTEVKGNFESTEESARKLYRRLYRGSWAIDDMTLVNSEITNWREELE